MQSPADANGYGYRATSSFPAPAEVTILHSGPSLFLAFQALTAFLYAGGLLASWCTHRDSSLRAWSGILALLGLQASVLAISALAGPTTAGVLASPLVLAGCVAVAVLAARGTHGLIGGTARDTRREFHAVAVGGVGIGTQVAAGLGGATFRPVALAAGVLVIAVSAALVFRSGFLVFRFARACRSIGQRLLGGALMAYACSALGWWLCALPGWSAPPAGDFGQVPTFLEVGALQFLAFAMIAAAVDDDRDRPWRFTPWASPGIRRTSRAAILQGAVDGTPVTLHVVDADFRLVAFNAAFRSLARRMCICDPVLDSPVEAMMPRRQRAEWMKHYEEALRGELVRFDWALHDTDGSMLVSAFQFSPLCLEGRTVGVIAVSRDVTEARAHSERLRQSEEHFRMLVEQASDVVMLVRMDGDVGYVSPSAARVLGWYPGDGALRSLLMLSHPDDVAALRAAMLGALRSADHPAVVQFRARHRDGNWRRLEAALRVLDEKARAAQAVNLVVVARDVTGRDALEQDRRKRERAMSLGRLTGDVAHEFSNILTTILGNASLAAGAETNREALEAIRGAADRGRALLSRFEVFAGPVADVRAQLVPGETLARADELLGRLLGSDIFLTTHIGHETWAVCMEPRKFEMLLVNLTMAARTAMPDGGRILIESSTATITEPLVGHGPRVEPGDYVTISVVDSGTTSLESLTDGSAAVDEALAGLALCESIIQIAGGFIWTYHEAGRGNCRRLFLPRYRDAAEESEPPRVASTNDTALRGHGECILVAEDEPSIRALTAQVLRKNGYSVIEAVDGRDALAAAMEYPGRLDLVLTDLVMPAMNGDALLREVQKRLPRTRGLLMSGFTASVARERRLTGMGWSFIGKPFAPAELIRRVHEVLSEPIPSVPSTTGKPRVEEHIETGAVA